MLLIGFIGYTARRRCLQRRKSTLAFEFNCLRSGGPTGSRSRAEKVSMLLTTGCCQPAIESPASGKRVRKRGHFEGHVTFAVCASRNMSHGPRLHGHWHMGCRYYKHERRAAAGKVGKNQESDRLLAAGWLKKESTGVTATGSGRRHTPGADITNPAYAGFFSEVLERQMLQQQRVSSAGVSAAAVAYIRD